MDTRKKYHAFTLIEVLVTLAIMASAATLLMQKPVKVNDTVALQQSLSRAIYMCKLKSLAAEKVELSIKDGKTFLIETTRYNGGKSQTKYSSGSTKDLKLYKVYKEFNNKRQLVDATDSKSQPQTIAKVVYEKGFCLTPFFRLVPDGSRSYLSVDQYSRVKVEGM